jgi:hypothetical protein
MRNDNVHDTLDILHHVGVINADLNSLSEKYEKLGFLLTPVSIPKIIIEPSEGPVSLGIGNRHAIFEDNYLELLGIIDATQWAQTRKDNLGPYNIDIPLNRFEGLHVMHFGTCHIEHVRDRFCEQNLACSDIKHFERNVQTDTGERTMRARTISFPAELVPEGLVQVAQHDTPDLVFQSQFMAHPNGAVALTEIILCCEDQENVVKKYERLVNHPAVKIDDSHYAIDLGCSKITVIDEQCLSKLIPSLIPPATPFMAGFVVETIDLQLVRNVLQTNGVLFSETNSEIVVNADHGGGCAIIFRESIRRK